MPKRVLVILLCLLACGVVFFPGSASTAPVPRNAPVITGIAPTRLGLGDMLVIRGRNFIPGNNKNTVVFQRDRARAVFVKADRATRTRITLRIPAKLQPYLTRRNGQPQPTRFRLRVLARRFGPAFTTTRLSPIIGPKPLGRAPAALPPELTGPDGDCDGDGVRNRFESDADNDLISDATERTFQTNFCNADSDGDMLEDGYEYESATDLNVRALPYPGKRPYPNPLDGSDPNVDHDGDGMTTGQEYAMWARYGGHALPLSYSAGTQNSNGPAPVNEPQLDWDGDGSLSDEERDVDGDGLSNMVEANTTMNWAWWGTWYKDEKPYSVNYPSVDFLDRDSDGDGLRDGDDDIDHDDYTNIQEMRRVYDQQGLWVQPLNPCLPNYVSRTCARYHPPPNQSYPPYDDKTPRPFVSNPLPCPYPSIAAPTAVCQPSVG